MRSPSSRLRAEYSPQQQQFAWLPWPFVPFCPWHPAAFQRPQEALELPPLLSVLRLGQLWPSVSSWPARSNSRARARMRSARHLCLHSSHNHRRIDAATEPIGPDRQPGIKSQYELSTVLWDSTWCSALPSSQRRACGATAPTEGPSCLANQSCTAGRWNTDGAPVQYHGKSKCQGRAFLSPAKETCLRCFSCHSCFLVQSPHAGRARDSEPSSRSTQKSRFCRGERALRMQPHPQQALGLPGRS